MKIKYDNIADAMYIRYSDNKVSYTKDNKDHDWIVDFDENWDVVWIEMWWVKDVFKENNMQLRSKDNKDLELV